MKNATGDWLTARPVFYGATRLTVNSYPKITATVPSGAKAGKIGVTTPKGRRNERRDFHGHLMRTRASGLARPCL